MDDSGHSQTILVVSAFLLAVSVLSVGLRCFVRTYVLYAFGWDDGLMVIAMVSEYKQSFENMVIMLTYHLVDSVLRLLHLWNNRGQL